MSHKEVKKQVWKPKYPIKELPHNLWNNFPDWGVDENHPHALQHAVEALKQISAWQDSIISDLVAFYDYLEKERKESNGEVSVKACYVYQKQIVELFLGCSVKTAKQFLRDIGFLDRAEEKEAAAK